MKKKLTGEDLIFYERKLFPLVEETVLAMGYKLLTLSFECENMINYLRVTIFRPEHLITLNDCELVSRKFASALDEKDLIPFSYTLEIQSSGIENKTDNEISHEFVLDKLGITLKS